MPYKMARVAVLLLDVHLQVALLVGFQRAKRALEGGLLAALQPLVQTQAGLGPVALAAVQAAEDRLLLAVVFAGAVAAIGSQAAVAAVPVARQIVGRLAVLAGAQHGGVGARVVHVAAAGDPILGRRVADVGGQLVEVVLRHLGEG